MKNLTVKAPGKIIVSGEHAVVYGYPAVVAAIDRTLTLSLSFDDSRGSVFFQELVGKFGEIGVIDVINELNIRRQGYIPPTLESSIPIGCGMGSSAALAAAISLVCLYLGNLPYDLKNVNKHAFLLEKRAHQNPSGIDNTIVTFGGALSYQRQDGIVAQTKLQQYAPLEHLIVVNTGKPDESTSQMVQGVRTLLQEKPQLKEELENIGGATNNLLKLLKSNKNIGEVLQKNEHSLEKLEVVGKDCQSFIRSIENAGGYAKISGAGGFAHKSGVVIVDPNGRIAVMDVIKESGYEYFPLKVHGGLEYVIS